MGHAGLGEGLGMMEAMTGLSRARAWSPFAAATAALARTAKLTQGPLLPPFGRSPARGPPGCAPRELPSRSWGLLRRAGRC